jgi:hypothetical protein
LGTRSERPRSRSAAKERNELAPLHLSHPTLEGRLEPITASYDCV